jgi:hypothetical protein
MFGIFGYFQLPYSIPHVLNQSLNDNITVLQTKFHLVIDQEGLLPIVAAIDGNISQGWQGKVIPEGAAG